MRLFGVRFALLIGVLICSFTLSAESPKREMRAVWLTTVWGLDWPAVTLPVSGGQTWAANQQKDQMLTILDRMQDANLNTIFFQVRSECDAFYQSSYEPWSSYFADQRVMDDDFTPAYDPLEFVVEEAHKRGMEVHAWLNPYRFESSVGKYEGSPGDYRETHPEWVLEYEDGGSILDPGNPGVRERIVDIVSEIITEYDVDGIVFDDYFYAYGGTPTNLDSYSQDLYKPDGVDLHDWRRGNVDKMVSDVYDAIQDIKPWITFGVSPFGIWTTREDVAIERGVPLPEGITTNALDAYSSIYCDPVAWLEQGTVDYISPQIYWKTNTSGLEYSKLSEWWSDLSNRFRRHFYSSHSLSGLSSSSYAPEYDKLKSADDYAFLNGLSMIEYQATLDIDPLKTAPTEWGDQIFYNRKYDRNGAPGSVFFRAQQFGVDGFIGYLATHEFKNQALQPAINWKEHQNLPLPENIVITSDVVEWDFPEIENVRFVVYAVPAEKVDKEGVLGKSDYLLGVSYSTEFDLEPYDLDNGDYVIGVSALDRFGNEFPPVLMGETPADNRSVDLIFPDNEGIVHLPFSFSWSHEDGAQYYIFEVASDFAFNDVVYRRELTDNSLGGDNISLDYSSVYYWRVATRKAGAEDKVSETFSFTYVSEPSPVITYPQNNESDVEPSFTVEWEEFGGDVTYNIQISTNSSFTNLVVDKEGIEGDGFEIVPGLLTTYQDYYIRMAAVSGDYTGAWSSPNYFSTVEIAPVVPQFISPANNEEIAEDYLSIEWEEDIYASAFNVEISPVETFPALNKQVQTVDAGVYSAVFDNLDQGLYYIRVRARYGQSSSTDWSEVISVSLLATFFSDIETGGNLNVFAPGYMRGEEVTVEYELPGATQASLYITDITGRVVKDLYNGKRGKGSYTARFNSGSLPKGVYLITLDSAYGRETIKVIN
ncbi:family 10 glycosylhydrolase [Marinilabiliaceae bacterium ANBcel2]|nr:family 10 glycosylhydrolase [Marinilabiliaceae bacterium ANBcel2]